MIKRRLFKLLALLFAFALIAAACGDSSGSDDNAGGDSTTTTTEASSGGGDESTTTTAAPPETTETTAGEAMSSGGTLIWAHEQEPPDLHLSDPNNNLTITAWILQPLLEDLYGVDSTTSYYPELLAEEGVLTTNDDGSVTVDFKLRDGLMWSDGVPFTSEDVKFTYDTIMETDGVDEDGNPNYILSVSDRTGLDTITDFTVKSDTEFSVTWSDFFAGWKGVFGNILPAHALPGGAAEAEEALRDWTNAAGDILPSTGPMVFDSWEKGVSLKMVRNENYHGSHSPDAVNTGLAYVDGVTINFVPDTDAQINALKAGEADMIMTQPQLQFGERLSSDNQFTVASTAGPVFEHWGLNLLNVHLADPLVREALAYSLDKSEVMAGLYTPLFGDLLPAEGLGNTYWMSNQPAYVDHQTEWAGAQVDAAKAKLEEAGYTMGDDGFYTHPERGKLTLRVGTTGGNALRELQQQIIQEQMKKAGIEIVIDNVPGGAYFGEKPFSDEALAASASGGAEGDPTIWDITQFAWVGGPWPGGQSGAYKSDSGFAPYGFVNAEFDARSDECDATVDDATRADCYNELDTYVTTLQHGDDGLFMLPLTQKPSYYAYNSERLVSAGVAPDANLGGPLSNVYDFQFAG